MWWYIFVSAILTALVAGGLTMLASDERKMPVTAGVIALVVDGIWAWFAIYAFNPEFTHWARGGYGVLFWFGLIIAIAVAALCSYGNRVTLTLCAVVFILPFIFRVIFVPWFTTPGWCDTGGNRQVIAMLNLQDAQEGQTAPDIDINKAVRVSLTHAQAKAMRSMRTDNNMGSYLKVGSGYLQTIQGKPYYVFALVVTNRNTFLHRGGGVIPGYILVDASDPEAEGQWVSLPSDQGIKYAQGLRWYDDTNLDRYAYFNYALPHHVQLAELDGIEVDDEMHPWYTATILEPKIGYQDKGYYPTGMLLINPTTGAIQEYSLDQVPTWVDRKMPEKTIDTLVKQWGSWSQHEACKRQGGGGQKRVDEISYVWSSDGLVFQYVMTSSGSDGVSTDIIYVNPRTFAATRYKLPNNGDVVQTAVMALVQQKGDSVFVTKDLVARNCQIEFVAGKRVWYCVLEKEGGAYWGVALVQPQHVQASSVQGVIVAKTLEEAYNQLRTQIAEESVEKGGTIDNSSDIVQVDGTIERVGTAYQGTGVVYIPFTLRTADGVLACRVTTDKPGALYIEPGDQVTITAVSVNADTVNDVISIVNHTYPLNIGEEVTPEATPATTTEPTS